MTSRQSQLVAVAPAQHGEARARAEYAHGQPGSEKWVTSITTVSSGTRVGTDNYPGSSSSPDG